MIRLEDVTKIYPGQERPAVDHLNLEIPEGAICVLVGPSGCGKTTTMRMINRLIQPTSGRIWVDGRPIDEVDPIRLRRRIGYVIQEIGLFPHMTIAQNIATVPLEEGWPRERIEARVDELLRLVGLEPGQYRDRYPSDLSGGQRQRVGVARAMAADPPVLLMDEPFGALDPINRSRIQSEFLKIQEQVSKTIVFVTHDIDEAIKMGDLIVVMRRGRIIQQGPPEEILSSPANGFVERLVGRNRSIKRLHLFKVADALDTEAPRIDAARPAREALARLAQGENPLWVVDAQGRLVGEIREGSGEQAGNGEQARDVSEPVPATVSPEDTLNDALSQMLESGEESLPCTDRAGRFLGSLPLNRLLETMGRNGASV